MAAPPPVMLSAPNGDDPFTSPGHAHAGPHRYASFDNSQLSALYNSGSPSQAKRALEAHMKDTDRRIQEASRLGQTLLKQRKELTERLKDVEHERDENEIGPELQKKLAELEKEYTQVGKESARNFLPKNRIVSGELGVPGSPSVFSTEARASPSKPSVPSRRQRNQPANRVHDIEFATEISTSLLAQVRQLQAVLAEKEDALRTTTAEKTQLDADVAGLMHRLKVLDDNENKYKEENWNLETQLQEIQSALKDLTDKDQRLNQMLKTTQSEKDAAQRELEDLKQAHGKLAEEHDLFRKQNDSEMHTLRRDVANHDTERESLHKRIEELTSQNTELARAVAANWGNGHNANDREFTSLDEDGINDHFTPEDSPPPSPSKTPARNGQLESETLRSSLTHAHRMIQNLKNNIHREKTEKLELKRMLQDARDEVETLRSNGGGSMSKKRRSDLNASKSKQSLRPERLGATRSGTHEIIMDDDDWEDHDEVSPSRVAAASRQFSSGSGFDHAAFIERDSTDAFETANERDATATESDAFQTGVEDIAGDSDQMTETESTVRVKDTTGRPSIMARMSYQSTASTDDENFDQVRTPVQQHHPKLRLRNVRGRRSDRASEIFSDSTVMNDSPAGSFQSDDRSTPAPAAGQNLMAELEGLSDDDTEEENEFGTPGPASLASSVNNTPSRFNMSATAPLALDTGSPRSSPSAKRSAAIYSITPTQASRPQMVDSGMMTEPWEPETKSVVSTAAGVVGGALAGVAGYALGRSSSNDKEAEDEAHAQDESKENEPRSLMNDDMSMPRRDAIQRANMGTPRTPLQRLTDTLSQQTQPVSPVSAVPQRALFPQLAISTATAAETEPISPARSTLAAPFGIQTLTTAETAPVSPPRQAPPAALAISSLTAAQTEPVSPVAPVIPAPVFAPLSLSSLSTAHTQPAEPEYVERGRSHDPFSLSTIVSQYSEPVTPAEQIIDPFSARKASARPGFYTDSGVSPEREERGRSTVPAGLYADAETSPEVTELRGIVPGTEAVRPGAGFFATHPIIPPPATHPIAAPSATRFPPRASSIRGVSPEKLLYATKDSESHVPTLVYADENAPAMQADRPASSNSRMPFAEVSSNVASTQPKPILKRTKTSEQGTQTMVSSEEIEKMLNDKNKPIFVDTNNLNPRRSSEGLPPLGNGTLFKIPRRPGSSGSIRKNASPAPPLPPDHTLKIAAAGGKPPSSSSSGGFMGPPSMPASAYKNGSNSPLSKTTSVRADSLRHGTASLNRPRASNSSSVRPTLEPQSPHTHTRRSSVTSFASELDERFNISRANIYPDDMPPMTDPRMIQAITQTMIGEHLWKYTRKTGRSSEISGTRHRRFFWVHPYTRTLYWSEHDPSLHGAKQSKAKSVAIEAVRVISDDNAYPPGLHRKSLVVVTPGREIVFTAPTGARHETWFNALSYLLLRTGSEREGVVDDAVGELTREDVDEFNPQLAPRSSSRATGRTRMSLSSYNSRATFGRPSSPNKREYLPDVPTLSRAGQQMQQQHDHERREQDRTGTVSRRAASSKTPEPGHHARDNDTPGSMSSRFGGLASVFKTPGSLRGSFSSSRRSKSALSNRRPEDMGGSAYGASVIMEDSDDDLGARQMELERERGGDMENVRACCNGKHDVGSLSHRGGGKHTHSHIPPAGSAAGSMIGRHGGGGQTYNHAHPPVAEPTPVSSRPRRGE